MNEGNGALRILQLIKSGQSQGTTIALATVTKASPLSIRIDGDSMDTPEQALIVAESLTEHKRTISLKGGTISGEVVGFHGPGTLNNLNVIDANMTIKSPLSVGNRVIVAIASDGQLIYVLDKAVI